MRVLTLTSLYPSRARPRHGIFVEARVAAMKRACGVDADIVVPVASFPLGLGGRVPYDRQLHEETRLGGRALYPRFVSPPGAAMYVQPWTMAAAALRAHRRLAADGAAYDVIDAHYLYPDGVAAAVVAKRAGLPLVLTARGSDVNRLADFAWPRRFMLRAIAQAQAVVTVSAALAQRLRAIGVAPQKLAVVPNGVDLARFAPSDRGAARARFGLPDAPLVMSCGNLVPEKGHEIVIDALAQLPGVHAIVVGAGPLRAALERRAAERGVGGRVAFLGERSQQELAPLYAASDAVVLASSREGMPNVLLEAMACGTRVVAAAVGGVPEIVTEPAAGIVVGERTPAAFAHALAALLAEPFERAATRRFAERFDWTASARAHCAILEQAAARRRTLMPCAAC
jgi:glycosyltransferase involved in cell wall biosynthesis